MKQILLLPINCEDSLKAKLRFLFLYFDEIIFDTRIGFIPDVSLFDEYQSQYKKFKDKLFKEFDYEFENKIFHTIEDNSILNVLKLASPIIASIPSGYNSNKEKFVYDSFQIQPRYTAAIANVNFPNQISTSLFGPVIEILSGMDKINIRKNSIIELTISKFPEPPQDLNWEKFLEFKNDSKFQLLSLRNWINEISSSKLELFEIEERLEYLMHEYQRQFELHKIKYSKNGKLRFIGNVIEALFRIGSVDFPGLRGKFIEVRKEQATMLREELELNKHPMSYFSGVTHL